MWIFERKRKFYKTETKRNGQSLLVLVATKESLLHYQRKK